MAGRALTCQPSVLEAVEKARTDR